MEAHALGPYKYIGSTPDAKKFKCKEVLNAWQFHISE